MLDAALVLVIDSATSVIRTSLGAFWVIPHVVRFDISAGVFEGGRSALRTQTFRLACEVFPE